MKISVVMCTYNGEEYISGQLKSILAQNLQPDEVIIQDDCSNDNTYKKIQNYIEKNNLNGRWHLNSNICNLGWRSNFANAINKASGDLIFLCDQDDIWEENKIERMVNVFLDNSQIELLVSDFEALDFRTGKKVKVYHPKYGAKQLSKIDIRYSFAECGRPGCTYAFSKDLFQYFSLIWSDNIPHDLLLWCLSISRGTLYSLNEKLVNWRRHQFTSSPSNDKQRKLRSDNQLLYSGLGRKILEKHEEIGVDYDELEIIKKGTDFYSKRADVISSGNLLRTITLFPFIKYYPRFRAFIGDLVATANR